MQLLKLGKYAKTISGYAFKSEDFLEEGVKVIKISNIGFGEVEFDNSNTQYVDENFLNDLDAKFKVSKGDILISLTGSHISQPNSVVGKVALYNSDEVALLNQRAGKIVNIDKEFFEPRYLFYVLSSRSIRMSIALMAHGAASQANVSPKDIDNLKLFVPNVNIQTKIAGILSVYDELIENNKKRIALLETMAEELYKEWFVRFRFPDYENTEFEIGMPKNWHTELIKNLVDRKRFGKLFKEDEVSEKGNIPVYDQSRDNFFGFYNGEPEHKASFENPIIIFGDHTCKMKILFSDFSLAENVIPLKAKDNVNLNYLFYLIKDSVKTTEYKRHWTELTNKKVLIAPIELQNKFSEIIQGNLKMIDNLVHQNFKLAESRDSLLPRLISGKLSVEHLDIQQPPTPAQPNDSE